MLVIATNFSLILSLCLVAQEVHQSALWFSVYVRGDTRLYTDSLAVSLWLKEFNCLILAVWLTSGPNIHKYDVSEYRQVWCICLHTVFNLPRFPQALKTGLLRLPPYTLAWAYYWSALKAGRWPPPHSCPGFFPVWQNCLGSNRKGSSNCDLPNIAVKPSSSTETTYYFLLSCPNRPVGYLSHLAILLWISM